MFWLNIDQDVWVATPLQDAFDCDLPVQCLSTSDSRNERDYENIFAHGRARRFCTQALKPQRRRRRRSNARACRRGLDRGSAPRHSRSTPNDQARRLGRGVRAGSSRRRRAGAHVTTAAPRSIFAGGGFSDVLCGHVSSDVTSSAMVRRLRSWERRRSRVGP